MASELLSVSQHDEREVILKFRPANRNGKGTLAAYAGAQAIFVDSVDVTKISDRDRYVDALAKAHPGLDPKEIAAKLLELVGGLVAAQEGVGEGKVGFETQSQALIRLAAGAEFFRTEDGKLFTSVPLDGHQEIHLIRSSSFRRWLTRAFFAESGGPPSADAMQSALGVLEAKAEFDGPLQRVWTRVAEGPDGLLYLDLCDDLWRAIEISIEGWRIVGAPPVRFRRAKGMAALPVPVRGRSIDELRKFVNVEAVEDWRLLVATMTAYLRPNGPYPIVAINGEQGSAKSTTTRVIRKCIDPNATLLRCEPKEIRDFMIAASNSWTLSLDNLSSLPPWLSDALCRLATGGGFATRTLYENDDETHFDAMRPVLLNGIEDVATRFDLLDRCVVLRLPTIQENQRREEGPFWKQFESDLPTILGALLDAVVGGLRQLPSVQLATLPRMADFARWGEAVGRALGWGEGAFLAAYERNRRSADEQAIEGSTIASAVCTLVSDASFSGNAQELLDRLGEIVGEKTSRSKGWPQSPRGMSACLARVIPALRKFGVEVTHERAAGGQRKRLIRITNCEAAGGTGAGDSSPMTGDTDPVDVPPNVSRLEEGQGIESAGVSGSGGAIHVRVDGDFEEARL